VPFREESYRSSCIYSGPLHSYSRDAVIQHLSTRAGAESIQLIYSGRTLQALNDRPRSAISVSPHFLAGFFFFLPLTRDLFVGKSPNKNTGGLETSAKTTEDDTS